MNILTVPTMVLRDTQTFFAQVRLRKRLGELIGSLTGATVLFLALFGCLIGAFHGPLQALTSAIKLPLLYLLTLLITFPTLYVFNILFGARFSMRQYFSLLLGATAINSVLLLGFAPIGILFMLTSDSYLIFKLINILMLAISGMVAMRFFYQGMGLIDEKVFPAMPPPESIDDAEKPAPARSVQEMRRELERQNTTRRRIMKLWVVLYALVGSQLAWTLKPFFGVPGKPFVLFDDKAGNFFTDVLESIAKLLFSSASY